MQASKRKVLALDLCYDIVGAILNAAGVYTFAKMADFAPGGLTGLALILNHLWNLPIGLTTAALNIPLILLSHKLLGRTFLWKTLRTMVFCTILLDGVFPYLPVYAGSRLLAALYSGILVGVAHALFYMRGSSSGGTDFITMSVKALRPHLSIGIVTMSIDFIIILLGWPAFGSLDAVLYGLTATFVGGLVIDKILYGMGAGTLLIIVTDHGQEIARRIGQLIGRGSTELKARGSYTQQDRDVLLCACSRSQTYLVRHAAQEIDKTSFIMITETNQVFGEGFSEEPPRKAIPSKEKKRR